MIEPNERDIEKDLLDALAVLSGEPPSGMEGRILASIETRKRRIDAVVVMGARRAAWRPYALAAMLAAAVATGGLLTYRQATPGTPLDRSPRIVASAGSRPEMALPAEEAPAPQRATGTARLPVAGSTDVARPASPVAFGRVDASYLPSLLAPPMPPTSQEKLLLRMARGGDPRELSAMDPSLRAELAQAEREDFDRFFPKPPPPPAPAPDETVPADLPSPPSDVPETPTPKPEPARPQGDPQ